MTTVETEVRSHGPDDEPAEREQPVVTDLRNRLARAQRDLQIVASMLLEEAQNREWCDEYDRFCRNVNERLGRSVLRGCVRENMVHIGVQFTWQGESHEQQEHRPGLIDALHRAIMHMTDSEPNLPSDMNWSVD